MIALRPDFRRWVVLPLLLLFADAARAQAPQIATQVLLDQLGTLADSLAARDALSGVIIVAKDGKSVFAHAYGLADRETRKVNTVGTVFNVSSIGKRFTQVAVEQLAASGRLHLDSTIASVWPDYPNRAVAHAVTIRQLLEHRSGIAGDVFQHPFTLRRNSDYLPLFVWHSLRFAPGTREEYSNAGYIVLGEIVARASGEEYYGYVHRHVFNPASMRSSGFYARDSLPPFAAIGYTRQAHGDRSLPSSPLVSAANVQPRRGSAAGGVYASAPDLLGFLVANRSGHFALPADDRRSIIAGGSPGSNAVIAEGLPGGYDLIVLENLDPPAADAIVEPVLSWLGAPATREGRRIVAGGGSRPVAGAATRLPNTPAGRIAADYLRAYNTGDQDSVRVFFETEAVSDPARPTAARVARYKSLFADLGRIELASVDKVVPNAVTIGVSSTRGQPLTLTFEVEANRAHRLTSITAEISR